MNLPDPPTGRNMHRPQVGDTVRVTFDALVTAVSKDGYGITVDGGVLCTTLHRDHMRIISYHQEADE